MTLSTSTLRRTAAVTFVVCVLLVAATVALGVVGRLQGATRPEGSSTLASDIMFVLAGLVFGVVGAAIAVRQPRNTIGWLLLAICAFWVFALASSGYADLGINISPGSVPNPAVVAAMGNWMWIPAVGLMATFVVFLFPDGHLPSRGWAWLPWTAAAVMVLLSLGFLVDPHAFEDSALAGTTNPFAVQASWLQAAGQTVFVLFPLCMVASAVAVVQRYRRSTGVERLQMKWLAAAGAFFAVFFASMLLLGLVPAVRNNEWLTELSNFLLPVTFCAFPLAIGAAVLRYRLYDIDLVINKALVFGALAAFITGVYVAIVVGIGTLVGRGEEPNLALSIVATAVVAVAFQPVRERVQRFANRLVYGQRATPYEVLSEFADRVGGSYDAGELLPRMAQTVAQGVGAEQVEVWMATGPGLVRETTWPSEDIEASGAVGGPEAVAGSNVDGVDDLRGDRVVEVRHQGELLGALTVVKPAGEALNPTEEKLLDDVAAQAGLVLRNVRLIEDLRSSRQRLVSTADEERRRLERNLHDGAQQSLVSVALMIQTVRMRVDPEAYPALVSSLDQATTQLRDAIEELRELARGIHPVILTERGLGPAIGSLAERSPVPVNVDVTLQERLPATVEASLYFVVAEALTNVAKYAHATEATVTVSRADHLLTVEVRDNGIGGADPAKGSGLRGLTDRVAVVDGTLAVSSPPGQGTTLTCTVPLPRSPAPVSPSTAPTSASAMAVTP